MSGSSNPIRDVYDDIIDHLHKFRGDKHVLQMHYGAFGPEVPTTSETLSIPVLHLSSLTLDAFIDHCRKHPCYIESELTSDQRGRHTLWLHFYWIDRTSIETPPVISKRVRFASPASGYPSSGEFLAYVMLGMAATVFGLTKNTLFGI